MSNLSSLRGELRDELRIDPNGRVWSDDLLDRFINNAHEEISRSGVQMRDLEESVTFTTSVGVRDYTFTTLGITDVARILSFIYDHETVATITGTTLAFNDANPDTITDSGSGFVTAGFAAGMKLEVLNSTSNDGVGELEVDTAAAGTLTLTTDSSVTAETAGASLTIVGRSNPDNTSLLTAVETIDELEGSGFTNTTRKPSQYVITENSIVLDSLCDESVTCQIRYVQKPTALASDTDESDFDDDMDPTIIYYAEYLAWETVEGRENQAAAAFDKYTRTLNKHLFMSQYDDKALGVVPTSDWRRRTNRR